jgi:hypothetical protein
MVVTQSLNIGEIALVGVEKTMREGWWNRCGIVLVVVADIVCGHISEHMLIPIISAWENHAFQENIGAGSVVFSLCLENVFREMF